MTFYFPFTSFFHGWQVAKLQSPMRARSPLKPQLEIAPFNSKGSKPINPKGSTCRAPSGRTKYTRFQFGAVYCGGRQDQRGRPLRPPGAGVIRGRPGAQDGGEGAAGAFRAGAAFWAAASAETRRGFGRARSGRGLSQSPKSMARHLRRREGCALACPGDDERRGQLGIVLLFCAGIGGGGGPRLGGDRIFAHI